MGLSHVAWAMVGVCGLGGSGNAVPLAAQAGQLPSGFWQTEVQSHTLRLPGTPPQKLLPAQQTCPSTLSSPSLTHKRSASVRLLADGGAAPHAQASRHAAAEVVVCAADMFLNTELSLSHTGDQAPSDFWQAEVQSHTLRLQRVLSAPAPED